jgi:hypothetical protein
MKEVIYSCYFLTPFFRLYISFTIGSLMNCSFFFWVVGVLSIFNLITFPLRKSCAKCHLLDIIVATTNGDVHYYVCGVKTTIKKVGFLQASIVPTIGDLVFSTIEGKWLEVVVGMLEVDFLVQPCPKQIQLLIKTKLHGKILLILTSQLVSFEKHIEPPYNLAFSLPFSLDLLIDVEPTSKKWKFDFDVHKPNPKIAKS